MSKKKKEDATGLATRYLLKEDTRVVQIGDKGKFELIEEEEYEYEHTSGSTTCTRSKVLENANTLKELCTKFLVNRKKVLDKKALSNSGDRCDVAKLLEQLND